MILVSRLRFAPPARNVNRRNDVDHGGLPLYKVLLCWRYLRTRYLAMLCIVSVMLGVATLIVVNSVMAGFSTKLRERLHGLLSDVLVEGGYSDGFAAPAEKMRRIWESPIGNQIEAMTPTMYVLAMNPILHPARMLA